MRILTTWRIALCAVALVLVCSGPASAYLYIEYNEVYTDDAPAYQTPQGETPWLTALFEEPGENIAYDGSFDFTEGVLLTLASPNLVDAEFVSDWYFAFTSAKNVDALAFTSLAGVEPQVKKNADWTETDGFPTAGAGVRLSINIPYPTKEADRFSGGLISQILITGLADLTAEDFHVFIDANDSEFISVAHIQSINIPGVTDDASAWVKGYDPALPAPEPSTWLLLGLGLLCLPLLRRFHSFRR